MEKSNATHSLFAAHAVALSFISEQFSPDWDDPRTTLMSFGDIVTGAFLPELAPQILMNFQGKLVDAGVRGTNWAQLQINDLERQIRMDHDSAKNNFPPFHDKALAFVAGIMPSDPVASTKLRTVLSLLDQAIIPAAGLKAIAPMAVYKASALKLEEKDWAKGPMLGLQRRLDQLTNEPGYGSGEDEAIRRAADQAIDPLKRDVGESAGFHRRGTNGAGGKHDLPDREGAFA